MLAQAPAPAHPLTPSKALCLGRICSFHVSPVLSNPPDQTWPPALHLQLLLSRAWGASTPLPPAVASQSPLEPKLEWLLTQLITASAPHLPFRYQTLLFSFSFPVSFADLSTLTSKQRTQSDNFSTSYSLSLGHVFSRLIMASNTTYTRVTPEWVPSLNSRLICISASTSACISSSTSS